jgi:hypothetical protein
MVGTRGSGPGVDDRIRSPEPVAVRRGRGSHSLAIGAGPVLVVVRVHRHRGCDFYLNSDPCRHVRCYNSLAPFDDPEGDLGKRKPCRLDLHSAFQNEVIIRAERPSPFVFSLISSSHLLGLLLFSFPLSLIIIASNLPLSSLRSISSQLSPSLLPPSQVYETPTFGSRRAIAFRRFLKWLRYRERRGTQRRVKCPEYPAGEGQDAQPQRIPTTPPTTRKEEENTHAHHAPTICRPSCPPCPGKHSDSASFGLTQ